MRTHPALRYAEGCVKGKIEAPRYVVKQCEIIANIWVGEDPDYTVDGAKLKQVTALLGLIRMPPNSPAAGKTVEKRLRDTSR